MRSSAHIKGHPIHPMLVPFPFAYLFGSALVDLWAGASRRRGRWHRTARDLNTLGLASAVIAAVPGLVDYLFAVPPKSSARTRATRHMLANFSAVGLFTAARMGRREDAGPTRWSLAAEIAGAGLLATGGWLGGTLVFRNQIAVDHRYADAGKWQVHTIDTPGADEADVDVGSAADLQPDQMRLLRIGDRRIVLARTDEGYVAFDDRCTHRGGPLSDGVLACGTVQCPWHGSQFDVRSGTAKRGPAQEAVATYEVSVREGRVTLHLNTPARPEDTVAPEQPISAQARLS
jgi:nitrite reductase/ring-hydroxylating ferredoxin subunit/uncharacterized membrane protein